jgi:hypothetical protein
MWLASFLKDSVLKADDLDSVWQNAVGLPGWAMAQIGEVLGDLVIGFSPAAQVQDDVFHFGSLGEAGGGVGGNWDLQSRGSAAAPHNSGLYAVWGQAMNDDLVDQAAQKWLFVSLRQSALVPDAGEPLTDGHKRFFQLIWEGQRCLRVVLLLSIGIFGLFEGAQGLLPASFQFSGHEAVVRIDAIELSPGEFRLVAKSF